GTADAAFHLGIAEASGNPVLIEAMRFFIDRLRDTLRDIRLGGEIPEAGPAAHRAVLDAIAARDPDAAAAAAAAVVEPALVALEDLSAAAPSESRAPESSPPAGGATAGDASAGGVPAGGVSAGGDARGEVVS